MSKISASDIIRENITSITEEVDVIVADRENELRIGREVDFHRAAQAQVIDAQFETAEQAAREVDEEVQAKEELLVFAPWIARATGVDSKLIATGHHVPEGLPYTDRDDRKTHAALVLEM